MVADDAAVIAAVDILNALLEARGRISLWPGVNRSHQVDLARAYKEKQEEKKGGSLLKAGGGVQAMGGPVIEQRRAPADLATRPSSTGRPPRADHAASKYKL
jgi:hypothetical protein